MAVCLVLFVLACLGSLALGVRNIALSEVFQALRGAGDVMANTDAAVAAARIPRTVLGMIAGAGLAVAGVAFQSITRNPLADPGIFGILHGAALAVVIGLALGIHASFVLAILGAALAGIAVFALGTAGRSGLQRQAPLRLALAGAAIGAVCLSLIRAVTMPNVRLMDEFRHWQIGGIGGANWSEIAIAGPMVILGLFILWGQSAGLNALALGDEAATGLGFRPGKTRLVTGLTAIAICGAITAACGPIAFVGLIVPHVCRLIGGGNHRVLLPASALAGAALVLGADTIGRLIYDNTELAVGILIPMLGAPIFLWIVRRTNGASA